MVKSNLAIASSCCCLFLGTASFHVKPAYSFLAPESRTSSTRIRPYNYYDFAKTQVHTTPQSSISLHAKNTDTTKSGSGLVDGLWEASQEAVQEKKKGDGQITTAIDDDEDSSDSTTKLVLVGGTIMVVAAAGALAVTMGNELGIDMELGQLMKDPSTSFDTIVSSLATMDPQKGMLYFSSFYILAEILAIPAVPILTASSGYLFGTIPGTATCLFSAAVAASISFVIGRTLLRGYVENVLDDNPKFRCMDTAIEKEGFKLMLLLRLSPLFPFALSNYLYGASSIQFLPYFFGTLLGFAPGTFAYVYAGRIGKALTMDSASSEPWYVYAGGLAVVVGLIKVAGDIASEVIDATEESCEV
mmetsp:Transcript_20927/g.43648  ORF Transcript_20927/g.43648 Transcript_20927/m.43648 type:complete len:359 (+) Transcript_20927:151-1227(+)